MHWFTLNEVRAFLNRQDTHPGSQPHFDVSYPQLKNRLAIWFAKKVKTRRTFFFIAWSNTASDR